MSWSCFPIPLCSQHSSTAMHSGSLTCRLNTGSYLTGNPASFLLAPAAQPAARPADRPCSQLVIPAGAHSNSTPNTSRIWRLTMQTATGTVHEYGFITHRKKNETRWFMKLCFHSNDGHFVLAGRRLWDNAAHCSALLSSTPINCCCILGSLQLHTCWGQKSLSHYSISCMKPFWMWGDVFFKSGVLHLQQDEKLQICWFRLCC